MPRVGDILSALQGWAPPVIAWERDNVGLLIGRKDAHVERVLLCLDVTPDVVEEAVRERVQLIVAHHPVIFHPLKSLRTDSPHGAMLAQLLRHDIGVIAAHTNADATRFGLNHALAEKIGLRDARPLDPVRGQLRRLTVRMDAEAPFASAVRVYLEDAAVRPVSRTEDSGVVSIECDVPVWQAAEIRSHIAALPDQAPHSISEQRLEGAVDGYGIGAVGTLDDAVTARAFLETVKSALGCEMLRVSPFDEARRITRVAVCSGSGSSYVAAAVAAGADALVTGDLTHHTFLDFQSEILLVDAGHYDTERLFITLCEKELNMVFENREKIDILCTRTNTNPIWFV